MTWYDTYPNGTQTNPTGASSGADRVVRGGGDFFGEEERGVYILTLYIQCSIVRFVWRI
jgi:hypothetical protein